VPVPRGSPEADRIARRIRALAHLLDAKFEVPGTSFRFGLDAIIGLVPGLGDAASAAMSAYLLLEARRLGVPPRVMSRMLANAVADLIVGAVPIAGDVFDAAFRANLRNARLIDAWLAEEKARASVE
jgi:hypothetical protein